MSGLGAGGADAVRLIGPASPSMPRQQPCPKLLTPTHNPTTICLSISIPADVPLFVARVEGSTILLRRSGSLLLAFVCIQFQKDRLSLRSLVDAPLEFP
jgi:hypothetical protein